jgi:hypothetical protein
MTDAEILDAMRVLDRSLAWLRHRFPAVPVTVAYLPGALSVYRFEHDPVGNYSRPGGGGFIPIDAVSLAAIARTSDFVCRHVRETSIANGAAFIDTRPALREAATTQLIHGPRDWHHYNRAGYTVLGKAIAERLSAPGAGQDNACAARPADH